MTDRQIKTLATKIMYRRVYDNMILPGKDIYAMCSDGRWIRRYWSTLREFGWDKWEKV